MTQLLKSFVAGAVAAWFLTAPAAACVGKTVVIGSLTSPEGRIVAQVIAILINERTGTTVKIEDFPSPSELHAGLAAGEVDIAVEDTRAALSHLGLPVPADRDAAFQEAKKAYMERLNLVWLPPLGFTDGDTGVAAPVARKDTLKKFPALPRLIAKTEGLLPDPVLASLASGGEPAKSAREFLRKNKLI